MQVFEAGAMGCADGLAQEFRRRIANVPLGGSLEVVVSDPAAKRGSAFAGKAARAAGHVNRGARRRRLTITVERQK